MVTPDKSESREAALRLIRELAEQRLKQLKDEDSRRVLSPEVVDAIFEVAWAHQFDRDRTEIQHNIRDIIQGSVRKVVDNNVD